jgi:hypothetical protein
VCRSATTKLAISAFVCLNLVAVVSANRHRAWVRFMDDVIRKNLSPTAARSLEVAGGLLRRYANIVGLDHRWDMFSSRPGIKWRYLFTGRYADGSLVLLPIPMQSERSLFQAKFLDFRESKIQENLFFRAGTTESPDMGWMGSYVGYLCHAFPRRDGAEIRSITVGMIYQELRERSEAERTGAALPGREESEVLGQVPCD